MAADQRTSATSRTRDRALVELARARGWVEDAALDGVLDAAGRTGRPVAELLGEGGWLRPEELRELAAAVDGRDDSAATWAGRGDQPPADGATLPAPSAHDATLRAPSSSRGSALSGSDSGVTLRPESVSGGGGPHAGSGLARAGEVPGAGEFFGPYKLLRELGRGGMGIVYRALHLGLRHEVALKVLRGADADDATLERFRREAALVARIGRHPHLVAVHDVGRVEGRLYFTMDYVEGRSVRQRIDTEGAVPPRDAARIAAEVAGALEAAHRAGVVHRDVKPHNVLLDERGASYLSDFGLAKDLAGAAGVTMSGEILGTPAYMSPEQASGRGRQSGPATDIYALGATLYEMLTGHVVFGGTTAVEILRQVVSADPVPPAAIRPGIHRDLEVICLKALRKEPSARYASAAEMGADLGRFLSGEAIHARPAGLAERLAGRARRHPGAVVAAVLAILASAGVATAAGIKAVRRQAEVEREQKRIADAVAAATPHLQQGRNLLKVSDDARRSRQDDESRAAARQAAAELREAARLLPGDPEVHYEMGRALKRLGDTAGASAAFEEAVRLRPNHAHSWYEHGLIAVEGLYAVQGTFRHDVRVSRVYRLESAEVSRGGVAAVWDDTGRDDPGLRKTAARDFGEVVNSGVGGELHAYGNGMLLFLSGKPEPALEEMGRALKINGYFLPALRARAEILELLGRTREALQDRRALYELEPTVENGWTLAWMLAEHREKDDLAPLLRELYRLEENGEGAVRAGYLMALAGDVARGIWYTKASLSSATAETLAFRLSNLLTMQYEANRSADAIATWSEYRDRVSGGSRNALDAWMAFLQGDIRGCARQLRTLPPDSPWRERVCSFGANAEWLLGNLDLALEWAELRAGQPLYMDAENWRAQVRMDLGDLQGALEDLETIRKRAPDLNANLVFLAGTRLRLHDPAAALEALVAAVESSALNEKAREAARRFVKGLEPKVLAAKRPEEEIAIVETLAMAIAVVSPQAPANRAVSSAALGAQRGLWYLIQQMASDAGLWEKSFFAGSQFLAQRRVPNVLYRQAVARARQERPGEALALLEEAVTGGFDDGGRLDRDAAFDGLRADERFVALRARCR